eukprot:1308184-Prymnesium_polylepis.1
MARLTRSRPPGRARAASGARGPRGRCVYCVESGLSSLFYTNNASRPPGARTLISPCMIRAGCGKSHSASSG